MVKSVRLIAVDLPSIVKFDNRIKTCNYAYPSVTLRVQVDEVAKSVVQYAINTGHCLPIYIGQVAPVLYLDTFEFLRKFIPCKYFTSFTGFNNLSIADLKEATVEKYETIDYAYDKQDKHRHIWEDYGVEVLE